MSGHRGFGWLTGARVAATLALAGAAITSCPMPFTTSLRDRIDELVEEAARGPQPEISVLVAGEEIPDGGTTDAFSPAVQAEPFDVEFTVHNSGTGALVFREDSPVELTGADAALFSVLTQPSTATVEPDQSGEFSIRFVMDSPGTRTAKVNVYTNDTDESPYEINISNTALPEIQVLQGSTEIASGTGTADFGAKHYGSSGDVEFTIKNLGKANLDLDGESPVGVGGEGFTLVSQPLSPVAPGGSTTFTVHHAPPAPGVCSGDVSIASSDADENPFVFALSGTCELDLTEVRIAGGGYHAVALKSDGTVWTWGYNAYGQLGDGTTTDRTAPVRVSGLSGVAAIAAGAYHTVALKSDGTVWAWGINNIGQVGDGTIGTNRLEPVEVSGLTGVVAVRCGSSHGVALKSDGTVWSWGYNAYGQIGDGTIGTNRLTPVQVTGLAGVVAVEGGGDYTVALKSDGTVWAWGNNDSGQLGDGTSGTNRLEPVEVSGLTGAEAIAVGWQHTVALRSDGTVRAWGRNIDGQLGDGTSGNNRLSPVEVSGLAGVQAVTAGERHTVVIKSDGTAWAWGGGYLGDDSSNPSLSPVEVSGLTGVEAVAARTRHTFALTGDGAVWAWGYNAWGQLGDGTAQDRLAPVPVSGLTGVASIACGAEHTVALKSGGTVWAWGWNNLGELGDGTTTNQWTPVRASGLTTVAAVAAGYEHTVVLKSDGTVWAWGYNLYGQLGDGSAENSLTPVRASGLTGVTAVASGGRHTVALKSNGTVRAWGRNNHGQVGDGTFNEDRLTPVAVLNITDVVAITAGDNHTVALKSGGTVWAWGDNAQGQLGDGTSGNDGLEPVAVQDITDAVGIAAGSYHSMALTEDGTVLAWGYNGNGRLGDGTTDPSTVPVEVLDLTQVVAIAAGYNHSVALTEDGKVWTWGYNGYGQLGDDSTDDQWSPAQVPGLTGVEAIAADGWHTVAIKSDGTVWTWGYNAHGQLGDGTTDDRWTPVLVIYPLALW